jgi:hypothetical protein
MKRSLLVFLLGLFIFTALPAQVKHRLTGPRAKNAKFWKKNKRSYEPVASLNGMTMAGRSAPPLLRKAKLERRTKVKPRVTGPRAKNTPHRLRKKKDR